MQFKLRRRKCRRRRPRVPLLAHQPPIETRSSDAWSSQATRPLLLVHAILRDVSANFTMHHLLPCSAAWHSCMV